MKRIKENDEERQRLLEEVPSTSYSSIQQDADKQAREREMPLNKENLGKYCYRLTLTPVLMSLSRILNIVTGVVISMWTQCCIFCRFFFCEVIKTAAIKQNIF